MKIIFYLLGLVISVTSAQYLKPINYEIGTELKGNLNSLNCGNVSGSPRTELQLFKYLTHPARYDRIHTPENFDENGNREILKIYIRAYVYYLHNLDTHDLQFKIQMRFQMRYNDPRLEFKTHCSNRTDAILGGEDLKRELWMPHLYFVNEKSSNVLGTHHKDILTSIGPNGTVTVSTRMQITLYCSMNFRKFPFDHQECKSTIGSWKIKSTQVKLLWERDSPFVLGTENFLTEYEIKDTALYESKIDATSPSYQYGDFLGNYSVLTFKIKLKRQVGCYLLEYYFPSMLIIASSWISFWLQADAAPSRTMLGMTSMLTFITLSTSQTRSLPKVSYIKVSEIWFIVGTLFIFASLVEFAFSNLVWRRKKLLELQKISTKNLLLKTLVPRSRSTVFQSKQDNQDEKHKIPAHFNVNDFTVPDDDESGNITLRIPDNSGCDLVHEHHLYTHQQVSRLIDIRARVSFPVAFFIFNVFYWIFVSL